MRSHHSVLATGFHELAQSSHFYQKGGAVSLLLQMEKQRPQEVKSRG